MPIDAVIVAAGSGIRAGGERPKQYQPIGGKPLIWWTLKAFAAHAKISRIQTVIGAGHQEMFQEAAKDFDIEAPVIGGATRQASCRAGMAALASRAPDAVLIHDAARPFVPHSLIDDVVSALQRHEAVVPGIPISDTLKRAPNGTVETTIDRAGLWAAQTPQGFHFPKIFAAHQNAAAAGVSNLTDDAAVAEWAGMQVTMIAGNSDNRKITSAADLILADRAMGMRLLSNLPDIRIGQGIDFHGFEPGDGVVLCGVTIPHDRRLKGHSDADAALHALTDALLGAIGEGDIGTHFPPSDAAWKGAPSRIFIEKAAHLIAARGGQIANVDLTILAEAPRIAPHVPVMREYLCRLMSLSPDRVTIKATTTEHMGFIGRREGLAAFAVATVRLPG